MLVHHFQSSMADVYMLSWAKMLNGESKLVSIRAIQNDIGDQVVR